MGKYNMTEFRELIQYFIDNNIKYELDSVLDGWQVGVPCLPIHGNCLFDVVLHELSYGHEIGELELAISSEEPEMVHGWLTAEEVIERVKHLI